MVKWMDNSIHIAQIILIRQSVQFTLLIPLFKKEGLSCFNTSALNWQLLRVVLASITLFGGYLALQELTLADATAISFAKVLFVTLFAAWFWKEQIGLRRITATLVGFIGVLMVVNPGGDAFNRFGMVAIISAASAAGVMMALKKLSQTEPPNRIILYQASFVGALALPFAINYWQSPTFWEWAAMLAIGVLAYGTQYCNIQAYKTGEASFVAPFEYSRLLFAGVLGYLLFSEIPVWNTLLGAILIICASLYTVYRELKLKSAD